MRSTTIKRWAVRTTWLACLTAQVLPALGDEPSRLGRLFRFGAASDASKSASSTPAVAPNSAAAPASGLGIQPNSTATSTSTSAPYSVAEFYGQPALSTPPSTPPGASTLTPSPRITPKPRVTKPVTEADPLVSRIALGRAEGGAQFGIFTQVFADGTVIDGEGVHKISPDLLKPVVEAVSSGEFARLKGHCGGPAGDTYETFQVVTYERAYGRLRANAFSYSGNPQGCEHAVHHLHKVLDELQMKMTTAGPGGPSTAALTPTVIIPPTPAPAPALTAPLNPAPVPMGHAGALPMPSLPDPGLH